MPENPFAFDPNSCNPLEAMIEWAANISNVLPDEPTCIPTLGLNGSDIVLLNCDGTEVLNLTTAGGGPAANAFGKFVVATQSDVDADAPGDTVTLVAGANIAITTNAGTDTITIACTGGAGTQNVFSNVSDGTTTCVADSTTDTLSIVGVDGVTVSANASIDTLYVALDFSSGYTATVPIVVSGAGDISLSRADGLTLNGSNQLIVNLDTATYLVMDSSSPKKVKIDWKNITGFTSSADEWLVHVGDNYPQWVTPDEALKQLAGYDASKKQVIVNDASTVAWMEIDDALNLLTGYSSGDDQSIGHDASGGTEWQDDDDACP